MSPPPATTAPGAPARPHNRILMIAVLGMLSGFAPMSVDMYLPSFPSLMIDLHADAARVQLTLSSFLLGFGLAPLMYGPAADRFGRRPILMVAAVLYVATSLGCALISNVDQLIVLRFLQALAAGGGPVVARAMIRDLYDRDEAARMMSVMMMAVGIAPMLAPLIGGYLLVAFSWRAIFWTLTGFGLICLVVVLFVVRETLADHNRRPLAIGTTMYGYASLIANRRYIGYVLTSALMFAGMFAYLSGSPFLFINVFKVPEEHYGLLFAINVMGMIVSASFNSRLVRRHGSARMLRIGVTILFASACAQFLIGATNWGGLPALMVALFPMFCALSMVAPNATALALHDFPHMAGTASALAGCLQFGLGAISGAVVGSLYNGTAMPIVLMIGSCAMLSVVAWFTLVRRATV